MLDTLIQGLEAFLDEIISGKKEGKPGLEHIRNFTSRKEKGLSFDGTDYFQSIEMSNRNTAIIGGTGTGKSSVFAINNLLLDRGPSSYVVLDPAGELTEKCSQILASKGVKVIVFNLNNPNLSHFYNPMKRLDKSFTSCKQLATLLVSNTVGTGKGSEVFWSASAIQILSVFIYITKQLDEKYQHLAMVLKLVNEFSAGNKKVDELAVKLCDNSLVWSEFKSLKSTDSRLLNNMISTAKVSLALWQSEDISYITSKDNISFELRQTPTAIFIQGNSLKMKFFAPVFSSFISQLFQHLLNVVPDKNKDLNIFFILDELASFYIPDFETILAVNRKFLVSISCLLQNISQLSHIYSERSAEIILANCSTQMYFSNQDLQTCKKISEIAGFHKVENEEGKLIKEQVLPIENIRNMPNGHAIILLPGTRPVYIDSLTPYYQNHRIMKLINSAPPFVFQNQDNDTGITPILDLN